MSYEEELREHARIAILRLLEGAPKYTSNVSLMAAQLDKYGIGYTRDQVEGQIRWLEEQGLLTSESTDGFVIATATMRGVDVATGKVQHPGVQRPRPRG